METHHTTRSKLLLVDDVRANLLLLKKLLEQDYDCATATDGASALEQAVNNPPDLILLDILMPELDGYEVCRRLKNDPRTTHIPVIFLTHLNEEEDEKKGLEAGAIDYIAKPFRLPIVKARVRNHLELKRRGDLLEQLAGLDGLTGIPNRRRFDTTLANEWQRAQRHHTMLALIMIDVDFFKPYNDYYGHPSGDDCLRKIAHALAQPLRRASDFLARYGGEEFAVILADTTLEEALRIAEHMRCYVAEQAIPHGFSAIAPHITVSLGIAARIPNGESSSSALLAAADAALYQAKHAGRNQVSTGSA
jgi:diguanylate cyclase (GGDEF)-like protein